MAPRTSLRLSRLSDRATVTQRQLIAFTLSQTGFLLPIDSVYRATAFSKQELDRGWIEVDQLQVPVAQVKPLIFGPKAQHRNEAQKDEERINAAEPNEAIASLILQQSHAQPHSIISIDSAPALCRIAEDRFVPLPHTYTMNCVGEMTDNKGQYPLYFCLSIEELLSQLQHQSSQRLVQA